MGSYDQPPGMGGYHYGPPHPQPHHQQQQQQPPPQHPHPYQQQHHHQSQYPPHGPPAHQQQSLPPMPQYPGQVPPSIPSQMPPPDRPGNGVPLQAIQTAPQPPRSIEPVSRQDDNGRLYKLDVVQQPMRARMCGFGDKDRRPITPPPCVRIIIIDPATGKEMDCNDIDHAMFVLNVDLWSEDGQREVNLVRHTNSAPSISSTTACSYTTVADSAYHPILPSNTPHRDAQYPAPGAMTYPPQGSPQGYSPAYGASGPGYSMQQPQQQQQQQQYAPPNGYPPTPGYAYNGMPPAEQGRPDYGAGQFASRGSVSGGSSQGQGMFTRNLIGSLAASAFRLTDTSDRIGIWFIMQDLSIRTEGTFRLRFSFVDVGATRSASVPNQQGNKLGKAPILACCYSKPFTVFSAKKFPGVCESTPLSKCFAAQGIKIPIRKEGQDGKRAKDDDDGDY